MKLDLGHRFPQLGIAHPLSVFLTLPAKGLLFRYVHISPETRMEDCQGAEEDQQEAEVKHERTDYGKIVLEPFEAVVTVDNPVTSGCNRFSQGIQAVCIPYLHLQVFKPLTHGRGDGYPLRELQLP